MVEALKWGVYNLIEPATVFCDSELVIKCVLKEWRPKGHLKVLCNEAQRYLKLGRFTLKWIRGENNLADTLSRGRPKVPYVWKDVSSFDYALDRELERD